MTQRRITTALALRMQMALQVEPRTYDDLVRITGLSKESVTRWVKSLRAMQPSPVHISGYAVDVRGRPFVQQFAWGVQADAPRPGPNPRGPQRRMAAMRARRKTKKEA